MVFFAAEKESNSSTTYLPFKLSLVNPNLLKSRNCLTLVKFPNIWGISSLGSIK